MSASLRLLEAARDPASADRIALIADGVHHRFRDLALRVSALAARLLARGVGPGSRVALIARNSVETAIAIHAFLELGVTLIPIHPRLTPPEIDALLEDGSAEIVLREADLTDLAGLDSPHDLAPDAPLLAALPPPDPSLLCAIVHTSGTTGRPKGAMLSRSAILASAAASEANLGWRDDDRWLLCMPLCHIGGLSILTRCLLARAAVILPSSSASRFDPRAVLDSISRDGATLLSVVPTMLRALLDEDRAGALPHLRAILVGGAGAPTSLLEACASRGVRALTTYGLTEACSQVTAQRPRDPLATEPGSGVALPGIDLRIARDDGQPAALDEVGHIQIRGPTLMRGYWPGPPTAAVAAASSSSSSSAAVTTPSPLERGEAWFTTGDLGALDEAARLHVHARRTDLIVTGGENVYPVEIEQAIEAFPGVLRALVFGVPDPRWGQLVAAAILLDPHLPADETALLHHLRARLAPHKRPRLLAVADDLPLTSSGKLDRASGARRLAPSLRPIAWQGVAGHHPSR